jgi:hypothetical protein
MINGADIVSIVASRAFNKVHTLDTLNNVHLRSQANRFFDFVVLFEAWAKFAQPRDALALSQVRPTAPSDRFRLQEKLIFDFVVLFRCTVRIFACCPDRE